jgi:hypothetical protein
MRCIQRNVVRIVMNGRPLIDGLIAVVIAYVIDSTQISVVVGIDF